ncbi:unnamed protein product [Parascedosporium putredinis]|uniref:Uncharacterized protein n=1 Tax=Parascedosporium putredinis TaxID=1442378 RepID=A0A9P1M550_9PEZI|nr:unnamed protein product [Parascedosporium putredinis]CAI7987729.1 unnamed protein product [Parascedosporium putredinis]
MSVSPRTLRSPKVVDVYTKVGLILSRHRSGPIPKPMKILPTVPHWEEILHITKPEEWSANACDAVTRVFVASKAIVVQRFLEMVLLEKVKEDIYENKKLNPHLHHIPVLHSAAAIKGLCDIAAQEASQGTEEAAPPTFSSTPSSERAMPFLIKLSMPLSSTFSDSAA